MIRRPRPDHAFAVELDDVQSLALQPHSELEWACYLLVQADSKSDLAKWLRALAPLLSTGKDAKAQTALNVALSHRGLTALGLDARACTEFGSAFQGGMAAPHRAQELGDVEDSASNTWAWGSKEKPVHAALLLFAPDARTLRELVSEHRRTIGDAGLAIVQQLDSEWPSAPNVEGSREHFGFVDGISQPEFRLEANDADGDTRSIDDEKKKLAPGELLLGYPDESGSLPLSPSVPASERALRADLAQVDGRYDLGRNGTYLVLRQIEQDVHGFWSFARGHSASFAAGGMEECAAKLIGRWRNGAPLSVTRTQPKNLNAVDSKNDFRFRDADVDGQGCPIGAHIRRANPRDTLLSMSERSSLAAVRQHRILRRGRPFGKAVEGWPDPAKMLDSKPDGSRGMYFLCLNADIERQFEFIQQRWLNDPTFANARMDEVDPILGRHRASPSFLVPRASGSAILGRGQPPLKRFTRILGGEYFFLPSRRAVRYLASLP